jgi:hypothetical protein
MPQETNFNVSPYFDDFDANDNYYKVLFKPGYPIQARELTNLQSILQNQTEQFGRHIFKDGSVVIPGQVRIDNPINAVEIESEFSGTPVSLYFDQLLGKRVRGSSSGVTAEIFYLLSSTESERNNFTLYVKYLQNGGDNFTNTQFFDGESLILETPLTYGELGFTIQSGQAVCNTIASNSNSQASSVIVSEGIYFIRGIFARVSEQRILLDQYSTNPSYKVGFDIIESIVTADQNQQLFDNAKGFSNYAAPGADRFQLELQLTKKTLDDNETANFVEILRIENGNPIFFDKKSEYSLIRDELARRTYDESGDYIVKPFNLFVRDCLNDRVLTDGVYFEDQITESGNTPSEDLMLYQISPGKAYVNGYDIETISTTSLDVKKPRTTNTLSDQIVTYNSGLKIVVNNAYGSASIGLGTTATVSLMDSRIGGSAHVASGTTIGIARVYDFIPESDYVDDRSRLNLRLFDIQTYTKIGLTTSITSLTTPAYIKGKKSNASGYLKESITNSRELTLYNVSGTFLENEQIAINGIDDGRLINEVVDYDISSIKSIYSKVGVSTFNADAVLDRSSLIAPVGTTFSISSVSGGGISTVTAGLQNNFATIIKKGDIISYSNPNLTGDVIYNKVESVSLAGTSFTISGITTVSGICDGSLPGSNIEVTDISIISTSIDDTNSSLLTELGRYNISSLNLENNEILQRRTYTKTFNNGFIQIQITEPDLFFATFDEDRFVITYSDGSIEPMRSDKYDLDTTGKILTFYGLTKTSETAEIIATVKNVKPNSKLKKLNKVNVLTIDKSKYTSSGIGTTTLNDGLAYSNVYGVRVQDEEICLNVPDIVRVLAVYESSTIAEPSLPRLELTGSTNGAFIIGENIVGSTSGSVALVVNKVSTNIIQFVYLNSYKFVENEVITGKDSGATSIINSKTLGDKNITQNFILDDGQRETIYDYGRIIRKQNTSDPNRKIKIIFQNYVVDSTDNGEFFTANSYPSDGFKHDVPLFNNLRVSDYIDIRPRVSNYVLGANSKSPFEFNSRNFAGQGQYSQYTLAPDENIRISYSYYLSRIDKVYLTPDGTFKVIQGLPNDIPISPQIPANVLDIATISIPSYLYNTKNVNIEISQHKRYRMSDIALLEDRIQRVEEYTTLSLLESKTENLVIKDASTGLDRFKCGFFVDNFSSHNYHDLQNPQFKCSIDTSNNTLRPSHYTTSLDLQLGSEAISGVGNTYNPTQDHSYVSDLGSVGVKRTGELVTLNYNEFLYDEQVLASRTENVTPYIVSYWQGSVELRPSFDNWIHESSVPQLPQCPSDDSPVSTDSPTDQNGIPPFDWISNARSILGNLRKVGRIKIGSRYKKGRNTVTTGNRGKITSRSSRSGVLDLLSQDLVDNKISTGIVNGDTIRLELKSKGNRKKLKANEIQLIRSLFPADVANNFINQVTNENFWKYGNKKGVISLEFTPGNGKTNTPITDVGGNLDIPDSPNLEDSTVTTNEQIIYLRSRNIEFDVKGLKPRTLFHPFFQGIDVKNYVIPKLLEVEMISGKFEIGETVESDPHFTSSKIKFRLCYPNHKTGSYNAQSTTESLKYKLNPYTQQPFQDNYTESSTVLNVDTLALQLPSENFYGSVSIGMNIIGKTSGAVARISNVRLVSDNSGRLIGSLFIPNPNISGNPKWINGENTFIISDSTTLSSNQALASQSGAMIQFKSSGTEIIEETNIITTREPEIKITKDPVVTEDIVRIEDTVRITIPEYTKKRRRARKDPLAQSFVVEDETGIFITSVEVYFETKDDEIPVTLQIRPMIAGVPSEVIVPFSEVVLDPDNINLSTDGSVSTKFTFPSPVYLSGPQKQVVRHSDSTFDQSCEYSIVLLSDSPNYRVFISQMGESDLISGVKISQQPTLGSLFKSQNGSTWTPSQLEDLKYKINRAEFVTEGLVRFYNPKLSLANNKITVTAENNFLPLSKKIVVGLGSTGYSTTNVTPGVTLKQGSATGKLIGIGGSVASGGIGATISNVGVGYTNGTFTNVVLITETGNGKGATANIGVVNSGIATVTITDGGFGYQVGDSLKIPTIGQNVGFGGKLTVSQISSNNAFIIDNIQGQFTVGITTLNYINSSGTEIQTGVGVTISQLFNDSYYDGLHMKVYHKNHGMHSSENYVKISKMRPLNTEVNSKTTSEISKTDTSIFLQSGSGASFATFEGIAVSNLNPGYVIIGNEVIGYTSVSGDTLISGVSLRGVDGTEVQSYSIGVPVYKYEFNGISLRRINKVHNFADVVSQNHPIDLDSYFIKIDTSSDDFDNNLIGKDRTNDLFFKETSQTGKSGTEISNNIQYEVLTPNINYILPTQTNMTSRIRTFTATSIGGNENSFVDAGFQEIPLDSRVYFKTPRLIASEINESKSIPNTPGNRSFSMEFLMTTEDSRVSPVIDILPSPSVILTSNLLNNPIGLQTTTSYALDDNIRSLYDDPHAAIYISNLISLTIPANSLKVLLTANKDQSNDIRVLYQLFRQDSSESSINWELFPGYSNYQIDSQGIKRVIDPSNNDGSADYSAKESSDGLFKDYTYTVDDLPDFTGFAIKIVMVGENQASPPIISQLRAIATAKPVI